MPRAVSGPPENNPLTGTEPFGLWLELGLGGGVGVSVGFCPGRHCPRD